MGGGASIRVLVFWAEQTVRDILDVLISIQKRQVSFTSYRNVCRREAQAVTTTEELWATPSSKKPSTHPGGALTRAPAS